jgi:hypothetical protein
VPRQLGLGLLQRLGGRAVGEQAVALAGSLCSALTQPGQALLELGNALFEAALPGLPGGDLPGQLVERGLALGHRAGQLVAQGQGLDPALVLAGGGTLQVAAFLVESGAGLGGVMTEAADSAPVALDLLAALLGLPGRFGDLFAFAVEAVAFDQQPLQGSRGDRFVLAQRRQQGGGLRLLARGAGSPPAGLDHAQMAGGQAFAGLRLLGLGGLDVEVEQQGLGAAQVPGDVAVAGGLAGLALEPLVLGLQRADDVVEALQVGLRRAQPELRLVPARVQARDAGGLLQQAASVARLGVDDGADAALTDDRGGVGAGGRIGEQELHVAGAHLLAVDAVGRALVALDPTGHVEVVVGVEGGRRLAVGVVELQQDLGDVACRAVRGPAEDDVFHAGAAHALGRGLPHHPAQGFDQVRLAAAVRADDSGCAGLDRQLGRVDKGLEAAEAEFDELDQACRILPLRDQLPW